MTTRTALVVGAVGRLGEAVLNQVIGRGKYQAVMVQGGAPLTTVISGLRVVPGHETSAVDDVYLVLSAGPEKDFRSFYGRDGCFDSLSSAQLLPVARRVAERGARRLLLLAPMPAWQQVAHAPRGLLNADEVQLASLTLESVVILRPVAATAGGARTILEHFTQFYLQLQMLMLPRSLPTLTSDKVASAAVQLLLGSRGGLDVIAAADLQQRLDALANPVPAPT